MLLTETSISDWQPPKNSGAPGAKKEVTLGYTCSKPQHFRSFGNVN